MKARNLLVLCFAIVVLASLAFGRADGNSKSTAQKKPSCCVNGAKAQGVSFMKTSAQTKADGKNSGQCDPSSKDCAMKTAGSMKDCPAMKTAASMKDCPMMKTASKADCCTGKAKASEAKNTLKKSKDIKTTTEPKGTK